MSATNSVNLSFLSFVNEEVLPLTGLDSGKFWEQFHSLINEYAPKNQELLAVRCRMQTQIDDWHKAQGGKKLDFKEYQNFLARIGYLVPEGDDFSISTSSVDDEISSIAGPQLVVPVKNARFALNAANARWGSLYDSLYGTDVIPLRVDSKSTDTGSAAQPGVYDQNRGQQVIDYSKIFLDEVFPLTEGSHSQVVSYEVYYRHLLVTQSDGTVCGLVTPSLFVAFDGTTDCPSSIVLKNNGLHVEIKIDRQGKIGRNDMAGVEDIQLEAAITTIMDFEDSVAAVDSEDKVETYRNWLGLNIGDLQVQFKKNNQVQSRRLNHDKVYQGHDGEDYRLQGRSLLLARNVGHLMVTELMTDEKGKNVPEGIVDTVITALIGLIDLSKIKATKNSLIQNSRSGSIYIVKPKMHGPDEVEFTCEIFTAVEKLVGLEPLTLKLGIMDEERRTTVNLKECIRTAKERVVFINTGFLDRTGDEIHTSMEAGAFLPKAEIKKQPWISAYEDWNVDIGLACGMQGRAQIGKGMWAMPDEMSLMMKEKIAHPRSGSNTAWVPSPSAAVLHAMHYHQVDVFQVQEVIKTRDRAEISDILTIPLMASDTKLSMAEVEAELENNIQGILGYVVRWVELGIGCSKVPDINNVGLMEDRATLRISCQHIANWLHHGICSENQVRNIIQRMAEVVDQQNYGVAGYQNMTPDTEASTSYQAATQLIFAGAKQPNGYTEPLLHHYRSIVKNISNTALEA